MDTKTYMDLKERLFEKIISQKSCLVTNRPRVSVRLSLPSVKTEEGGGSGCSCHVRDRKFDVRREIK